jgi:alkanesulfonate monooxygenase SsuD/methylene tetrahydromethanopterin reductase-like flavin-dependent oxidoreductase (luciferase family)
VKIDIFSEMQQPRAIWGPDVENHEHRLIQETLEQAQLADEMGYAIWWEVEHHTAEEFSFSSAPEIMLTAIARATKNLRVGHAAALSPFRFNHPIRIAERSAFLDHLSDGRFELGLARSTALEWRIFNIEEEDTRSQMQQAFEMIPKMWTQERFTWKSDEYDIPDRPIVPHPFQKPHPPLWQACSSEASFEQAGRNGVGALGVTLWAPREQVEKWIDSYRKGIAACDKPVGKFINNQVAFFTFTHVADSEQEAMDNGAATAAAWYTQQAFTFFQVAEQFIEQAKAEATAVEGTERDRAGTGFVGQTHEGEAAEPASRAQQLMARIMEGESPPEEEIYEILSQQESLIVGDKETVAQGVRTYQEMGIDRLMSFHQVGKLPQEKVLKSIRMLGELIPELDTQA